MNKKYTIVIPSAKYVPVGLQNVGKIPPIIYPVNQRPVFSYLYDQYKEKSSGFVIIGKEGYEKVNEHLKAYTNIKLIKLFQDEDLGYSIFEGIKNESDPIVINFGDTIVFDNILDFESESAFFYSSAKKSEKWTFFEMNDGMITSVQDKDCQDSNGVGNLFVGVFKLEDTLFFKSCLIEAMADTNRKCDSFYSALRIYSMKHKMNAFRTENWFDIGHVEKYFDSKLAVKAREFNHIEIDKDRGLIKKTSDDKQKFLGEIEWFLKLPGNLEYVTPRIFKYSTRYEDLHIVMEYYSYHTLHELFLYGDLSQEQWENIFKRILFVINDFES